MRAHSGGAGRVPGAADSVPATDHALRRHKDRAAGRCAGPERRDQRPRRDLDKRCESVAAREQRFDARVDALAATRTSSARRSASSQQASLALKREVERLPAVSADGRRDRATRRPCQPHAPESGLRAGARRLQVPGVRGSLPRLARRHPRPAARPTCRSSTARPTCSTSAAAAASSWICSPARGITRPRHRSQSRDGRDLPGARARRHGSGRGGYLRRCPDGSLGGLFAAQVVEHLAAGLPAALPRARVPQAAPRRTARARDAQSRVLGGVLRQLHPRHHARVAAPPRDAAVPRRRQRLHQRGRSSTARRSPTPTSCSR